MKRTVKIKTPFKTAYEILSRGIITEWQIRMLRKNIRNRWNPSQWTQDDQWNLYGLFEEITLDLTKEQQIKGIAWLKKTHFKLDGSQRKSSKLSSQHLFVIRNFSHFTFVGMRQNVLSNGQIEAEPIYRTHAKNGMYFDYIVNPAFFGCDVEYREVQGTAEVEMKLLKGGAK